MSKFVQDIHKQSYAFTVKPRPVKVSANKLSKTKDIHDSASSTRNAVSSAISHDGIGDLSDAISRIHKQIVAWQHSKNNIYLIKEAQRTQEI